MEFTAVLTPAEEGGYIALNPETGTTTQGETVEEAVANLKAATSSCDAGQAAAWCRYTARSKSEILRQAEVSPNGEAG